MLSVFHNWRLQVRVAEDLDELERLSILIDFDDNGFVLPYDLSISQMSNAWWCCVFIVHIMNCISLHSLPLTTNDCLCSGTSCKSLPGQCKIVPRCLSNWSREGIIRCEPQLIYRWHFLDNTGNYNHLINNETKLSQNIYNVIHLKIALWFHYDLTTKISLVIVVLLSDFLWWPQIWRECFAVLRNRNLWHSSTSFTNKRTIQHSPAWSASRMKWKILFSFSKRFNAFAQKSLRLRH